MVLRKAWPAESLAPCSALSTLASPLLGDYMEALLGWRYIQVVEWEEQLDDAAGGDREGVPGAVVHREQPLLAAAACAAAAEGHGRGLS